ncbi:MAG TPA: LppX_LprAFG lipoprotein [Ilumatobacter sp.]|nr:LppX_LprAFG lipoprotein [Ilumatobacter sp.]
METPQHRPDTRPDRTGWFAIGALGAAAAMLAVAVGVAVTRDAPGGVAAAAPTPVPGATTPVTAPPVDLGDGAVADPNADPEAVVADAATAMGAVTSVEFRLTRTGAPVFVDQFEAIAVDAAVGQFTVSTGSTTGGAAATLDVTVEGNLRTRIGAVAIGPEIWMSNPVTGRFETLPAGYDLDPSRFFDPQGGWQPLLEHLTDVELVGVADRGGQRWHVRGVAPAADVANITVGLVKNQDVTVELWVHPTSSLVTAMEFDTVLDPGLAGGTAHWTLDLSRYGDTFTINPPEGV